VRCFLAVPLAEPALSEARQLQETLRERVPETRWARPETLHITVHFFGTVDDARAATAVDSVLPVARRTAAFEVLLDRLGAFPPRGAPRVLWLGPPNNIAPLTALVEECRTALRDASFDVESRPYRAHCTLGRPQVPWSDEVRAAWTSAGAQPAPVMRFTASRLVLYESRPAPGGAAYTERWVSPFDGR
jgi:RNA 2',3'-cyclic 3'-phosphodiesterase